MLCGTGITQSLQGRVISMVIFLLSMLSLWPRAQKHIDMRSQDCIIAMPCMDAQNSMKGILSTKL